MADLVQQQNMMGAPAPTPISQTPSLAVTSTPLPQPSKIVEATKGTNIAWSPDQARQGLDITTNRSSTESQNVYRQAQSQVLSQLNQQISSVQSQIDSERAAIAQLKAEIEQARQAAESARAQAAVEAEKAKVARAETDRKFNEMVQTSGLRIGSIGVMTEAERIAASTPQQLAQIAADEESNRRSSQAVQEFMQRTPAGYRTDIVAGKNVDTFTPEQRAADNARLKQIEENYNRYGR